MSATIQPTDTKLDYVSIASARKMSGLRLVLGAYTIPGPWREACKGLFHVKRIPYTPVVTADEGKSDLAIGMDGSQSELIAWTGQASAPVAIWNDERPRSSWIDQLNLAERLNPEPPLIPAGIKDRILMFGLINELAGENGIAWEKRLLMVHGPLTSMPPGAEGRAFFEYLGSKYGYTPALAKAAARRIVDILNTFDAQLASQKAAGREYLVGSGFSALDIYWATFCGLIDPMPPERCPMATSFRGGAYGNDNPEVAKALTPALLAHRDMVYERHLELPVVF
jgi:glutathione S-transferase